MQDASQDPQAEADALERARMLARQKLLLQRVLARAKPCCCDRPTVGRDRDVCFRCGKRLPRAA